jgi:hypothetical protein
MAGSEYVSGLVRQGDEILKAVLPRAICPPDACIAGGSFKIFTQVVDPEV